MEKEDKSILPSVAEEYIESVIRHVRYREKIQDEVRKELRAHFADAMHGCEGEQERQKRAEELIAGFGDVKLLGKLIRRGKKRCRPLWRTMVVRAFQGVGVLFIALIVYIAWFFTGKPVITTDYLEVMNQQVRAVADESQNAKPLYEQAIAAYIKPGTIKVKEPLNEDEPAGEDVELDTMPRPYAKLSPEEQKLIAEWLSANQRTIELVRQGNEKPYYWRTYSTGQGTTEMVAVLLPNLQEFKSLAKLLCWQAIDSASKGRFAEAFDASTQSYTLGMHLKNKNILIEQLVGIAIEGISNETLRILLDEHAAEIDASAVGLLKSRFQAIVSDEDFIAGFEGERLFMLDEIQRSFTQTRIGTSHIYVKRINELAPSVLEPNPLSGLFDEDGPSLKWFHVLFTHPDREQTRAAAEQFYAKLDEYANYSPAELRRRNIDLTAQTVELTKGNMLLSMLLPALEKVIHASHRNRAHSEATLTIIAILQYQKQTGSLPQTLDDLVEAGLLQSVPIDPYSGEPLVYRVKDDEFTLYSVGTNFKDDGGVLGTDSQGKPVLWSDKRINIETRSAIEGGDAVFWPVGK